MSSDISACKLLVVGALGLGGAALTTTLAGLAMKQVVQQPILALVPFAALGAYQLISNNCMGRQSSRPIRNPSRARPLRGSRSSDSLARRALHLEGDERFARELNDQINGSDLSDEDPPSGSEMEVDQDYREETDRRYASLLASYENGDLLEMPDYIQTGTHGIQNRENSCV
ncbi:MAG: hypothetical protein K940chlam1_00305, partial [Candidatus Anoxychlamydiales bacterium]|nr:hypothetical protein [Candidatus Anoxychlamydiales bacterium]